MCASLFPGGSPAEYDQYSAPARPRQVGRVPPQTNRASGTEHFVAIYTETLLITDGRTAVTLICDESFGQWGVKINAIDASVRSGLSCVAIVLLDQPAAICWEICWVLERRGNGTRENTNIYKSTKTDWVLDDLKWLNIF